MEIRRSRRRSVNKVSLPVQDASEYLNRSLRSVMREVTSGCLHVTTSSDLRISFHEMAEYELPEETQQSAASFACIGTPFGELKGSHPYAASLSSFQERFPGFDGTLYLSPAIVRAASPEDLEFAARDIFRYNQMVMRHRPFCAHRHIYLGYDAGSKETAEILRHTMERRYPNVVAAAPFEYLYRIKSHESKLCSRL